MRLTYITQVTAEFPSKRTSNANFDVSLMWVRISCYTVEWPVIWDYVTFMWNHCNGKTIFHCFLFCLYTYTYRNMMYWYLILIGSIIHLKWCFIFAKGPCTFFFHEVSLTFSYLMGSLTKCLMASYSPYRRILQTIMIFEFFMTTSSNGNIFRVTDHLCGEFTGPRWRPRTQRPVTWSFNVYFDLRLNKRLSK